MWQPPQDEQGRSAHPDERDALLLGEEALQRAKEISRRITERVKQLTEDTAAEQKALDETGEMPPAG